jgi:mono/diheme cytochrome c family protein
MRFPIKSLFSFAIAMTIASSAGQALAATPQTRPSTPDAARGRAALFERCFSAPLLKRKSYEDLWKQWGLAERPADFNAQVRDRYGLFEPPYPNDGLPMGLRPTKSRRGEPAVGVDCMLCHAGSIFGKSIVGLPNTSLDLAALFRDLDLAKGRLGLFPYLMSNVRGTTEATASGIFLLSIRDADLSFRLLPAMFSSIPDQLCEDAPAWWLLKRKDTMYYNGQIDAHAVRPLMTFMLTPSTKREVFDREEATFADIRAFLMTIEPPKFPLPIDAALASRGQTVFADNCAKCHGDYGPGGKYPNKIVSLEKIGTDPSLVRGLTPAIEEHFRRSWFTQERNRDGKPMALRYNGGYQAPPLNGVWATAPYLHNGSVPTLYHLLKSDERPTVFTRSFKTGQADYNAERVGWKTTEVRAGVPEPEKQKPRHLYDTSAPGRSNQGHTFGDALSDGERRSVIEYLKTL